MFGKRNQPHEAELAQLENLLQAALQPQMPRSNYGVDLQRRLANQSAPTLEMPEQDYTPLWFLVATFVMMIFILWGVKELVYRRRK